MSNRVRVWDVPTRIFHWALVACLLGLVISGYRGGASLYWHARIGYAVLTLLLFRLVWGFVGGHWSRFASFLYPPRAVLAYLRGQVHPDQLVGHSPLGAASVFAMLALLLVQVATGLVGDDDTAFTGPLNRFVETSQGLAATWYHKRIGQWLIVALVALHVAAILYYRWNKQNNLIKPMLDGDKIVAQPATPSRDDSASRLLALGVLAVCGAFVSWLAQLGS